MTFFDFGPKDIVHAHIVTSPSYTVSYAGSQVTGSVYLERPYLNSDLASRVMQGFSERLGGLTQIFAGVSASVDLQSANVQGTNRGLYGAIQNLYNFHAIKNYNYHGGPSSPNIRVVTIPQIYYERGIRTGSFTGSDYDSSGNQRFLYDDAVGGIHAGSQTGSLVGNIFYGEGLVVLTASYLQDFGRAATGSLKWTFHFRGDHTIPVNVYRCRAPAGQLNASTNKSFYYVPLSGSYKNTRQVLTSSMSPYITAVGLYNKDYELVGVGRLAQPLKKSFEYDIGINLKLDW